MLMELVRGIDLAEALGHERVTCNWDASYHVLSTFFFLIINFLN